MIRYTLKTCTPLFLNLLLICPTIHASADTIPASIKLSYNVHPIYFFDEKEVDHEAVKKLNSKAIEKIEMQKAADAVRSYGIRGRYGVVKITSRKTPLNLPKEGFYSFTLYTVADSSANVRVASYSGRNLDTLFYEIRKSYPAAHMVIDDLIFRNGDKETIPLQTISGAFNLIYMKHNIDSVSKSVAEAIFYSSRNYLSGRFYFSGGNFTHVVTCDANNKICIRENLKRCTVGSIITLEGCQFRNSNNAIEFISKSIKLD